MATAGEASWSGPPERQDSGAQTPVLPSRVAPSCPLVLQLVLVGGGTVLAMVYGHPNRAAAMGSEVRKTNRDGTLSFTGVAGFLVVLALLQGAVLPTLVPIEEAGFRVYSVTGRSDHVSHMDVNDSMRVAGELSNTGQLPGFIGQSLSLCSVGQTEYWTAVGF